MNSALTHGSTYRVRQLAALYTLRKLLSQKLPSFGKSAFHRSFGYSEYTLDIHDGKALYVIQHNDLPEFSGSSSSAILTSISTTGDGKDGSVV